MALLKEDWRQTFVASGLADWFHDAPHKDFQLDDTTTVFTPSNKSYKEALFLLAIFISSFGALLFVLFVLYYLCCFWRFCTSVTTLPSDVYKRRRSCLKIFITILGLICSGAVILAYVFNGRTSDGVDQFRNAVGDIQTSITDATSVATTAKKSLLKAKDDIQILNTTSQLPDAKTALDLSSQMQKYLENLNELLPQEVVHDGSNFGDKVHRYDNYRWLVTVSLLTWCVFLCVFSFWVGCQTTVCIMFTLTFLSLSSVVLVWAVLGADFGIAMGVGDFCVNPAASIKTTSAGKAKSVVVDYYINCLNRNPFSTPLAHLNNTLSWVVQLISNIPGYRTLTRKILQDLDDFNLNLSEYSQDIACVSIHKEYMNAMDGLCNKALDGLAFVILSLFIIGLISGLLTCAVCPLWKYRESYHFMHPDVEHDDRGSGNPVLWWPTGVDFDPGEHHESPLQGHATADHTERAPLMAHQDAPNYNTVDHSDINYIRPNTEHNVTVPQMYGQINRSDHPYLTDENEVTGRHSF